MFRLRFGSVIIFPRFPADATRRRLIALLGLLSVTAAAADPVLPWSWTAPRATAADRVHQPAFDEATGHGFLPLADGGADPAIPAADRPAGCRFDVRVPPGNYAVTVGLRGGDQDTTVTIMAELRRLMVHALAVPAGRTVAASFIVNVRNARISDTAQVAVNERERTNESIAWDQRLTLLFLGKDPRIDSIAVRAVEVPTVFIAGDSTVCDQAFDPFASWGQMLPRWFGPGVAIANHAQSGASVASFIAQRRFERILSLMRPGDHLLIQFGHNDMKDKRADALSQYVANLTRLIAQVRERGGTPTLITSVERHRFVQGRWVDSLAGYPDAMKQVAQATGVALIDLHAISQVLYQAMGPEQAAVLFKKGRTDRDFDHTHHAPFGAYEIARCVIHGLRLGKHPLVGLLVPDAPAFDPATPDRPESVVIPVASLPTAVSPLGD